MLETFFVSFFSTLVASLGIFLLAYRTQAFVRNSKFGQRETDEPLARVLKDEQNRSVIYLRKNRV
jgi:hypothetical protein